MSGAFAEERAVVVGFGGSGQAAAGALLREGADVRVSEARPANALVIPSDLKDVPVGAGGHEPEHLDGATLVVLSPGVPEHAPVVRWALDRNLRVWSELELGARLFEGPIVAITGTNGKTSTTEVVAGAMTAAGLRARACGNVGYPVSTAASEGYEALAVECSSFQLRFTESLRPKVSVLVNLAPDHLDWHESFEAYAEAKARIFRLQRDGDVHIGNRDDPVAAEVSRRATCELRWFREGAPGDGETGFDDGLVVGGFDGHVDLGRPRAGGRPFLIDCVAAAAAGVAFGLPREAVARAVDSGSPGPHRGSVVGEVQGVRFVDDSKATNPRATVAALEGKSEVVLIAGGLAKGVDLSPIAAASRGLRGVVALGQAAPTLVDLFDGAVPVRVASSMEEAVAEAFDLSAPGGEVLLAPGCASMDMFRDYADRGDRFADAVHALIGARHAAPADVSNGPTDPRRSHA